MSLSTGQYITAMVGGVFLGIPVGLVFGFGGAAFGGMNGFIICYIIGNIVCVLGLMGKFDENNRKRAVQDSIINKEKLG